MTRYCAACKRVVEVTASTLTIKCLECGRTWPRRRK